MLWMIGLSALSTVLVLFLLGRRNERAVRRDWQILLSPRGKKLYGAIEGRVQNELALADLTYEEAFSVRELGSIDEAIELLATGYKIIETFAPNMLRLLAAMATFSRMVSAITPTRPLRPRDFKLAQIVSLAYLNQILHQFAVSTAERFRLRVFVIGRGFGVATRYLMRATARIVRREPEAERDWEQIADIRQDFQALTDESLESLRALLTSLDLDQREDLLRRLGP